MLTRIQNSFFAKFLWGFMGLYLLNISVDTADPNPEFIPEDLSYNDQESIIEILIEKVFGFDDAIKEYDDRDNEDLIKKNNINIDLLLQLTASTQSTDIALECRKSHFSFKEAKLTHGFIEIEDPPPKF
jgi:hypothetical protein